MKQEKNWLEWCVFAVSAALVALVLGQLGYDAATTDNGPPRLEIVIGESTSHEGHYAVQVTVHNHGDSTAEAVRIEVINGDERGELEFDYLPRNSHKQGWVTFSQPPGRLRTRVLGYKQP
jgi:uncharacterized protein (TIGR02588 family)